jgi:hypothetical protein
VAGGTIDESDLGARVVAAVVGAVDAVGEFVLAHALNSAHAIAAVGIIRMIGCLILRNAPSVRRPDVRTSRAVERFPGTSRRPFDLYFFVADGVYADPRASSKGKRRNVIVVVGILTVLVLAWLLFRAEARRHQ